MNIERIIHLADFIEALPPKRFTMKTWATTKGGQSPTVDEMKHDCGTCGCIGGWTELLFGDYEPDQTLGYIIGGVTFRDRAGPMLGLTEEEAEALFMPRRSWADITQAQAVATLRRLAETGKIHWDG